MEFFGKKEPKEVNLTLQEKVLGEMYGLIKAEILDNNVSKYSIPDTLLSGAKKVEVEGKSYDIWTVPGMEKHASSRLIEMAIEGYNGTSSAPSWSQIVSSDVLDETYQDHVSCPQTLYIK